MRRIGRAWLISLCGAVLIGGLSGCGDSKPSGAGGDAAYVSGFCAANVASEAEAAKVEPAGDPTTEDFKKLAPVFEQYATALDKLSPPADARDFHDGLVAAVRTAADKLASGSAGRDAFAGLEQMQFPTAVGTRLQALADKDSDCVKASVRFDQPIGG